jgi:hypothetical protein
VRSTTSHKNLWHLLPDSSLWSCWALAQLYSSAPKPSARNGLWCEVVGPGSGYSSGGPFPSVKRTNILLVPKLQHAEGKCTQVVVWKPEVEGLGIGQEILNQMLNNRTWEYEVDHLAQDSEYWWALVKHSNCQLPEEDWVPLNLLVRLWREAAMNSSETLQQNLSGMSNGRGHAVA